MSFDPAQIAALRETAPQVPRGLVAESPHPLSPARAAARRREGRSRLCSRRRLHARPQFIAYSVSDLPATLPTVARKVLGLPLLTWTVRSAISAARPSAMPTR